jgi:hypothetical protein
MKAKPPVTQPIKIVYPGDPNFERLVAEGTVASGDDKAWNEFIHSHAPARPAQKSRLRSKR